MSVIDGNLTVRGALRCDDVQLPDGSLGNDQFSSTDPLEVEKQEHQYTKTFTQVNGVAAASNVGQVIHVAQGDGELVAGYAGVMTACIGAATVTVDLKKNGASVLTSVITLDSGNAAFTLEAAAFSSTAYNADDVFSVTVVATAGGGTLGQGLFVQFVFKEDQQ